MDNITQTSHVVPNVGAYNPYSGTEALELTMKRIYAVLKGHQDFGAHLAYTHFDIDFTLSFKGEQIVPTVIKGKDRHELRSVDTTHTVTSTSPNAPDDGRREAGLPVPMPTVTAGGLVDIPLQMQGQNV